MTNLYEETSLTPMRVARLSGYIDWNSQPSIFKHYPHFLYRYNYGMVSELYPIELARTVTSQTSIGSKPYLQLSTPSAGNLHPVELYVQIRGVKGVLSGIYHVDAQKSEIVLIQEIESDGIETHVGLQRLFKGMIFLISVVPFRAEWKYKDRSIRYCYLDSGHQIATLSSALTITQQKLTILSEYNVQELNDVMGFRGEESIVAVLSCGAKSDKSIDKLKQNLMYVCPTDYSELSGSIMQDIVHDGVLQSDLPQINLNITDHEIIRRRSARAFENKVLDKEQLIYFMSLYNELDDISCYKILLTDEHMAAGVYLDNTLIKEGMFSQEVSHLLVDQAFVKCADIVYVLTSKKYNPDRLMMAAIYMHAAYMEAELQMVGCTGIGAFYDKKVQKFLATDEYILYVAAIGAKKV